MMDHQNEKRKKENFYSCWFVIGKFVERKTNVTVLFSNLSPCFYSLRLEIWNFRFSTLSLSLSLLLCVAMISLTALLFSLTVCVSDTLHWIFIYRFSLHLCHLLYMICCLWGYVFIPKQKIYLQLGIDSKINIFSNFPSFLLMKENHLFIFASMWKSNLVNFIKIDCFYFQSILISYNLCFKKIELIYCVPCVSGNWRIMISESPGSVIDNVHTRKYLPHAVPNSMLFPL